MSRSPRAFILGLENHSSSGKTPLMSLCSALRIPYFPDLSAIKCQIKHRKRGQHLERRSKKGPFGSRMEEHWQSAILRGVWSFHSSDRSPKTLIHSSTISSFPSHKSSRRGTSFTNSKIFATRQLIVSRRIVNGLIPYNPSSRCLHLGQVESQTRALEPDNGTRKSCA